MRDIPLAVYNRLKARQQIGDYRPNHEVYIVGRETAAFFSPSDTTDTPEEWKHPHYIPPQTIQGHGSSTYYSMSNFVPTAGGRHMQVWKDNTTHEIMVGYVDSENDYLNTDYPLQDVTGTGVSVETLTEYSPTLYRREDGKVLMVVPDAGADEVPCSIKCYISESGNGDDWTIYSTIYEQTDFTPIFNVGYREWTQVGVPFRTQGGRLILGYGALNQRWNWVFSSYILRSHAFISVSDDGGETWQRKVAAGGWLTIYLRRNFGQFCQLPDGRIYGEIGRHAPQSRIIYSDDNGDSWHGSGVDFNYNFGDVRWGNTDLGAFPTVNWVTAGSFYYDKDNNVAYRVNNLERAYIYTDGVIKGTGLFALPNPTKDNFTDKTAWQLVMAVCHDTAKVPGAVSSGNWDRPKIWKTPGGRLAIELGTGPPATLCAGGSGSVIIAMDLERERIPLRAKRIHVSRSRTAASALNIAFDNSDGILTPERGTAETNEYYKLLWMNNEIVLKQGYGDDLVQTFSGLIDRPQPSRNPDVAEIEVVARDHFKKCLDQTITVGSQNHAIHAVGPVEGIFRQLAQMAGFSNEKIFTEATGISVEKEFSWETYADAMQYLAEIVNYEIITDEYGNIHFLPQEMRGDVLEYDYVFREGEDIVRIDYEIDDDDLYYEVVVHGKNDDDEVIEVRASYTPREYYQVLEQKILKVDTELSTVAECQELADRTAQLMLAKPRCADFAAIAVPWLQVGDKILVEESSTTISEIYRIDEMDLMQEPDSFLMTLRTHHYAAPV